MGRKKKKKRHDKRTRANKVDLGSAATTADDEQVSPSADEAPTELAADTTDKGRPEPEPPSILERLLGPNEPVLCLISGTCPQGPAQLGLTAQRAFFLRSVTHGTEFIEITIGRRPIVDTLERDDGWFVTVTAEPRVLTLRAVEQQQAAQFSELLDERVATLGVASESWETMAADSDLWDEMRHYLTPANDGDQSPGNKGDSAGDDAINALQQEWIEKGALKKKSAWWPPTAASLVWVMPVLLLCWMLHTISIATSSDPSRISTRALIGLANRGEGWALDQLALRLTAERSAETKVAIAELLAEHSHRAAATVLLQDVFSSDSAIVRRAEIEALLTMKLGSALVEHLHRPGSLEMKRTLIEDLGEYADRSIANELQRYYGSCEAELRPALLRALARMGQAPFIVDTYERGTANEREACIEAVFSLPDGERRKVLESFLALEVAKERRTVIEDLLER